MVQRRIVFGFGVIFLLAIVQTFRFLSGRGLTLPVAVLSFLGILVIFASEVPHIDSRLFHEAPAFTSNGLMQAAAWLMMVFLSIEAVMTSRRLIRDSTRRLPPALLWVLLGGVFLLFLSQGRIKN